MTGDRIATALGRWRARRDKVWTSGTLTYTTAGLAALFCWLLWGDFAWSLKERPVPLIVQLLFKKFEASDMLTELLIGSLSPTIALVLFARN